MTRDAPVPWLLQVFALIGYGVWLAIVALVFAAVVPERAAAVHRTGPRGWWRKWTARNERILRERQERRG
jgi:hypothetical protein